MEYHWTPESYLATKYAYLNPSTNEVGRMVQSGDMQFEGKNYGEAERIYRAVLKESPKHMEALYSLGVILREKKDHAGAGQVFATAAAAAPDQHHSAQMFYNAATEYARAERNDDALQMLQKAFDAGYPNRDALSKDPNFARLKDDPRAKTIAAAR